MKTTRSLLSLLLGLPLMSVSFSGCTWLSGCGATGESAPGLNAGQGEIVINPNLLGAYRSSGGTTLRYRGLLLQRSDGKNTFMTERAPACARGQGGGFERLEGSWSLGADNQLVLVASRQTAPLALRYQLQDKVLRLFEGSSLVAELTRATSFCTSASDCVTQTGIRPQCVGQAVCTPAQTCGWACGSPPAGASFGDSCGGFANLPCATGMSCAILDEKGCPPERPMPDQAGLCLTGTTGEEEGCKGFLCTTGEHCEVLGGRAACVADSQQLCPRATCIVDQPHCVEWAPTNEYACLRRDECHRDSDCGTNKRCQPEAVCVRAPCFQPLVCR